MSTYQKFYAQVTLANKSSHVLSRVEDKMLKIIADQADRITKLEQNDHLHEFVPHTRRTIHMEGIHSVRETYKCKFCNATKVVDDG